MSAGTATATAARISSGVNLAEIEQLLFREAHCLDDRSRWQEWLDLYTEDAVYWIPYRKDQPDYVNHASICLENKLKMEVRIGKLLHGRSWSQQPPSRTARVVGNVMIVKDDAAAGEVTVKSTFTMLEFRRDQYQPYAGTYTHRLRKVGGQWKIAYKRIDLISEDGIYENFIQVPI